MKYLILIATISILSFSNAAAQRKVKLYFQLSGSINISDEIIFHGTQPTLQSKKAKVRAIDSLINYDEINNIIKSQDYKGVRILSELSLKGWNLESNIPVPIRSGEYIEPRVIFLLSKEFILKDSSTTQQ